MPPADASPPGLGPRLVGTRVVVRRVLRGETGPSGGPALTDVLGDMVSWAGGVTTIRTARGDLVAIAIADIVSGKPVPPRPSVRMRVDAAVVERRAAATWPAVETVSLGDWLLRASSGFTSRANSVLAVGDPGVPFDVAERTVREFYEQRGLAPVASVVVGSAEADRFEASGWTGALPGQADTCVQLASVSRVLRDVGRRTAGASADLGFDVEMRPDATDAWLADDPRATAQPDVARSVLEGPAETAFLAVRDAEGSIAAKGRAAVASTDPDWLGISDLSVAPSYRGRSLATVVMTALMEWGAQRGTLTACLQVREDNTVALAAYERLGFFPHHSYCYLKPPLTDR